jgi:hypothetical protein
MTSRKQTEFHKIALAKGWLLEQIAERWGISIRQMSRVANNATRKDLDAVNGLPKNDELKK